MAANSEENSSARADGAAADRRADPAFQYKVARTTEALKALLDALTSAEGAGAEEAAWADAAIHWTGVLSREQRRFLLEAAIAACAVDDAAEIMEAELLRLTEGPPAPRFGSVKDEARDWAFFAPTAVVKSYLVACFRALPKKDRIAALPALQRFALK